MSYSSVNQLPLGVHSAATVVAAPSAGNAPPQTSHYVQGTPLQTSAVASGITVNAHGLTPHGGIATTAPTVLSLSNQHSHSQGPTPASTPPAAPNDPKTTAHYQQQSEFSDQTGSLENLVDLFTYTFFFLHVLFQQHPFHRI